MDPIDIVKAVLPQLSDKQKEEVKALIGGNVKPCEKLGHEYKTAGESGGFWEKKLTLFCKRCGSTKQINMS